MKWIPWVSRERYDEMKSDLQKQIDALKDERITLLDHIQTISIGKPIFRLPPPKNIADAKAEHVEKHETREQRLIREARAAGYNTPRAIAEFITQRNIEEENDRKRRQAIAMFEQAKEEGQAAAQESKAQ